jgi:regulator of protease activity HflC (stomatin/prohibitin superfamily)
MNPINYVVYAILLVIVFYLVISTLVVVRQYERGVVLTLGRYTGTLNPGLNVLIPLIQTILRADIRVTVNDVTPQDLITRDNVSVKVTAVVYYRVSDPEKALLGVKDYVVAIDQLAQIVLRSTIGQHTLDELLSQQQKLNDVIAEIIAKRTAAWGVQVDHVEIRSVDLTPDMIRAMAQGAEAERGARARVTTAEGERDAARALADAAEILSTQPAALHLRTLACLKEVGAENATIIVFPLGQDVMLPSAAALTTALRDAGAARKAPAGDD